MDVLSDILRSVHLGGGVYFRCEFSAPWGMEIKPTPVAEFHIIVRGSCWLRVSGRSAPIPLQGGDLVAFPHGDAHSLVDAPEGAALPAEEILQGQNLDHYGPVTYGGSGLPATVLCGYFRIDREHPHPLVAALPSLIHIRGTDSYDFAWLQTAINFMIHETRTAKPGSEAVVNRLAEVLFVQMVRAHIAQTEAPQGVLAAIADKQIGAALQLMHQTPQQPWSLASLAQRIGMSRSAFAARFNQLVGQTPMQYLTSWRMRKARELLSESRLGTAAVAEQVGYQSEAAFSKAFKKAIGMGPGAYRRVPTRK
ncbi:MAG: AraC family transcriptional regulator [Betaproteobacteria bacterium]|nr:AraC family transcriptional regulator [Betaproteobacteria bacterium]